MLKILAILLAMLSTSCAYAPSRTASCLPMDGGFRVTGPSYTVDDLEGIGMAFAARNPTAPQVPFAYGNTEWNRMKALIQPGDDLRELDNPMVGPGLPNPDGYVLLRGTCVIAMLGLAAA